MVPFIDTENLEKILKEKHELFECKDLLIDHMPKLCLLFHSLLQPDLSKGINPETKPESGRQFCGLVSREQIIEYICKTAKFETEDQSRISANL